MDHLNDFNAGVDAVIEDSEASGPSHLEVKGNWQDTQRTFECFKAANDRMQQQILTKGAADPLTLDEVGRLEAALDALTHAPEASAIEAKSRGAPNNKAWPRSRDPVTGAVLAIGEEVKAIGDKVNRMRAGDTTKQAVVAIGREVLRQGQVIDRMAAGGRSARGAGGVTPEELAARTKRLEAQIRLAEVKADRPPGLGGRWPGVRGGAGRSSSAAAAYKRAVVHWMRTGEEGYSGISLKSLYHAAYGFRQKDMHTELNPAGGYLVHPERTRGSPLEAAMAELSPMRRLATVHTLTEGDVFDIPTNLKGTQAGWIGERESRPQTETPDIGLTSIPAMELYAMPAVSQRLLDNVDFEAEAWLVTEVAEAFALQEGPAYIVGDGIKKPRGLLTHEFVTDHAQWAHGKFRVVDTGVGGAFPAGAAAGDKLIDVQYAIKTAYQPNASWLFSRTTAGAVRKLKDSEGRYPWQPGVTAGQPPTLLASPINEDPNVPEIGTDTVSLGFGDWAKVYVIVEKGGVRMLRDPYSQKPNVLFYTTKLVGGGVQHFDAAVFLRFST